MRLDTHIVFAQARTNAQTQAAQAQAEAAQAQAQAARAAADAAVQAARQDAAVTKEQIKANIKAAIDAAREAANEAGQSGSGFQIPPIPPVPPIGPGGITTGRGFPHDGDLAPQQAVEMLSILGMTLVFCVVGLPLARAIARWIDRRGATAPASKEVMLRLEAIEQAVDSVAVEVERISEGQRFTSRLLSERNHEPARDFRAPDRDAVPVAAAAGIASDNMPANARRS